MSNAADESGGIFGNLFTSSSRSKTIALAAGGALALGIGGYFIYRTWSRDDRILSTDLNPNEVSPGAQFSDDQKTPTKPRGSANNPGHLHNPGNASNMSAIDYSKTRAELLAKAVAVKEAGNNRFKAGDYAEAIQCYSQAIEMCPVEEKRELATFYQNRAAAYDKLNELEKAYDDCTAALRLNKRYLKALARRADLCEKLHRMHEAMQDFMKCCILENFSNMETSKRADKALRELAQSLAKEYVQARGDNLLPFSDSTINDMLRSYACDPVITPHLNLPGASDHFKKGDGQSLTDGSRLVNGYAHGEPEECVTGYRKAIFHLVNRQYDKIIDSCTDEIDHFEQSTHFIDCLLLRATFYYFKGHLKLAEADLQKVFDILKDKNDQSSKQLLCAAHLKMSLLEHHKGNVDNCMQNLSTAEKLMPDNPDVYSLRGQVYGYKREFSKANLDFARCATLRPDFAHFAVQLLGAELKSAADNPEQMMPKIIRDFEDLVDRFPNSAEVNLIYAQVLCDAQQFEMAIEYFDNAQKIEPNNPIILSQRGLLELYFNNQEQMMKMLNQALKIDPHCLMALEIEAQYYSKKNDIPKMLQSYSKALEIARSEAEVAHFISMRETTLCQMKVAEEMLSDMQ